MLRSVLAIISFVIAMTACTHSSQYRAKPKQKRASKDRTELYNATGCTILSEEKIPFFEIKSGLFLTRILDDCSTESRAGIREGGRWIGMAVPCTGGPGRIEWRGNRYRPKMVTLNFGSYCPINKYPSPQQKAALLEDFSMTPSEKVAAINPMMVQFWEVSGSTDKGMGYKVELRSFAGLKLYKQMEKGTPLLIYAYGRESSWTPVKDIFKVTLEVEKKGPDQFSTKIIEGKVLSQEDKKELLDECLALKPVRPCYKLFPKGKFNAPDMAP